jgi:hypothetical protein
VFKFAETTCFSSDAFVLLKSMKLAWLIQAKYRGIEKMTTVEKYGKRRQITFRIGPVAQEKLKQAAALFNMRPNEYAKAILYLHLQVFNEPLDMRRRTWKRGALETPYK